MILVAYGTRPEWIKIKPLIDQFNKERISYVLLFTGQHTTLIDATYDRHLKIYDGKNRLNSIISSITLHDDIFKRITHTLVQGDTTTAFALALSSFHHQIPVIHLEAGLRTYDISSPYPEEFNRQAISRIASYSFCPTENNRENLIDESVNGISWVTGNTVLDNLVGIKTSEENKVLITMHRRENHGNLADWFDVISQHALENPNIEFIFPLHPNPNVQKHKDLLKGINVVEPMKYDETLSLISSCKYIITDSGGIQEEASFFGKPVIVCRQYTERTESLGQTSIMCHSPEELFDAIDDMLTLNLSLKCPYGDGHASEKIAKIIKDNIL